MNAEFDMTTLFFLVVAAIIFWRLRSVLGTRTGHERPPHNPYQNRSEKDAEASTNDNVIQLPKRPQNEEAVEQFPEHPDLIDDDVKFRWTKFAEEGSELAAGFDAIYEKDANFHPRDFTDGAKLAYEMIVLSFASGDKQTLKPLLEPSVYDSFAAAIDAEKENNRRTEMTFVGIQKAVIKNAEITPSGDNAEVTVKFVSELITTTYGEDDTILEGDPNQVIEIVDIWTFARPTSSTDPNWMLVATKSE